MQCPLYVPGSTRMKSEAHLITKYRKPQHQGLWDGYQEIDYPLASWELPSGAGSVQQPWFFGTRDVWLYAKYRRGAVDASVFFMIAGLVVDTLFVWRFPSMSCAGLLQPEVQSHIPKWVLSCSTEQSWMWSLVMKLLAFPRRSPRNGLEQSMTRKLLRITIRASVVPICCVSLLVMRGMMCCWFRTFSSKNFETSRCV